MMTGRSALLALDRTTCWSTCMLRNFGAILRTAPARKCRFDNGISPVVFRTTQRLYSEVPDDKGTTTEKASEEEKNKVLQSSQKGVLLTTRDTVEGRKILRELGIVLGSSIKGRNFFHDIIAAVRSFIGGEVRSYTQLINDCSADATRRMAEAAKARGATAVVRVRYNTSCTMSRTLGLNVAVLVSGSAVVCSSRVLGGPVVEPIDDLREASKKTE